MVRASGILGIGLLALFPAHQAVAASVKEKQRYACKGRRSGDVSRELPKTFFSPDRLRVKYQHR